MRKIWINARALRNAGTDAERHLWQRLRGSQLGGYKFRRQYPINGYIADFACVEARLVVELDGGQHAEQVGYDNVRSRALMLSGYHVLRFWNHDALRDTDAVLEEILRHLGAPLRP